MGMRATKGSPNLVHLQICRNYENKMTQAPYRPERLLFHLARRPLSSATILLAAILIVYPLYQRRIGNVYIETFNYVDGTTLIMVGILLLRGIFNLWLDTDLQAVGIALIGALSFVFAYEAIYKLSFFILPWRMPPSELREFVIQVAIALTALAGFAFGKFRVSPLSWIFAGFFAIGWIVWLLLGFPQLNTVGNIYVPVVNMYITQDRVYLINRATKIALCLVFYFLYHSHYRAEPAQHFDAV
jgi:hypothetical protein